MLRLTGNGRISTCLVFYIGILYVAPCTLSSSRHQRVAFMFRLGCMKVSLPPLETYVDVGIFGTFRLNLDNIALDDLDINATHSGIFLGDSGTLVLTVTGTNPAQ